MQFWGLDNRWGWNGCGWGSVLCNTNKGFSAESFPGQNTTRIPKWFRSLSWLWISEISYWIQACQPARAGKAENSNAFSVFWEQLPTIFFCCCCFLCYYGLRLLIYITCVAGKNCRKRGYARSPSTWHADVRVFPAILVLQLRKLLVLLLFSAAIWGCQLPGKKQCPLACAGPQTHDGQLFKLEKRDYEGDAE